MNFQRNNCTVYKLFMDYIKDHNIYRFFITPHIQDMEWLIACDTLKLHLFSFLFMKIISKRIEK